MESEDEKFFWLAEYLPKLNKTGIVYTGTQANTDIFLTGYSFKINPAAYSGSIGCRKSLVVEPTLQNNKYDCVISTNVLGMEFARIRFVIHTCADPHSLLSKLSGTWWQEVFKLCIIPKLNRRAFIDGSKPAVAKYEKDYCHQKAWQEWD